MGPLTKRYHSVNYGMSLSKRRVWDAPEPVIDEKAEGDGVFDALKTAADKAAGPQIEWSSIDVNAIPEEVVRAHPQYKELLAESIERRHTIKGLRDAVVAPVEPTATEPVVEEPAQDEPPSGEPEVPAYFAALAAQMTALTEAVTGIQATQVASERDVLLTSLGIPEALHKFIPEGTPEEMKASAETLKTNLKLPPTDNSLGGGAAGSDEAMSAFKDELMAELKGEKKVNIFSPQVQRRMGGGPI